MIPDGLFALCGNLGSVALAGNVTVIGKDAFFVCKSLTALTLPDSVTEIGKDAFMASGLQTMCIPSGVTEIKDGTFSGCFNLTTVQLPENLTTIGSYAFMGVPLEQITIPEHVTEIGAEAFWNCLSLEQIIMEPKNVPIIGNSAFMREMADKIVVPEGMKEAYWAALGFGGNDNDQGGGNHGNKDDSSVSDVNDGNDNMDNYEEAILNQDMLAGVLAGNDMTGPENIGNIVPGDGSNRSQETSDNNVTNKGGTAAGKSHTQEPGTGEDTHLELYTTLAMIAGTTYLLLYFTERKHGMTQERKQELVSGLISWAKQGGNLRKPLALTAIFFILLYYHSIGRQLDMEWRFE